MMYDHTLNTYYRFRNGTAILMTAMMVCCCISCTGPQRTGYPNYGYEDFPVPVVETSNQSGVQPQIAGYQAAYGNQTAPIYQGQNNQGQNQRISGYPRPFGGTNQHLQSAWTPPGIQPSNKGQWPEDEFIADGGLGPKGVKVNDDWSIEGLQPENTIVHYDTIDGDVKIEASNRVEIYAPKFRSVRQVIDLERNDQVVSVFNCDSATMPLSQERRVAGQPVKQHVQPGLNLVSTPAEQFIAKLAGAEASNRKSFQQFENGYKAYENLTVIQSGEMSTAEMAILAESARKAAVWEYTQNPQVVMSEDRVMAVVSDDAPGVLYTLEKDTKNPQVRIIKIASTDSARSGDKVEFTIRFDNVGDEPVGNVTIVDSLSGRLEFDEGSAQCSKEGAFMVEPNEAQSLVLRWEITDPLVPGDGGIIRFQCTVR